METRKQAIIEALSAFIRQRPGIDPCNYDYAGYLSESRSVTKDKHHAEKLLDAVRWCDSIDADALLKASERAYSGRLTIKLRLRRAAVSYCAGQYFPTEYRKAVAAVCASALWEYVRASMRQPEGYRVESWSQLGKGREYGHVHSTRADADAELAEKGGSDYGHVNETYGDARTGAPLSAGEWLRAHFAREFGRGIASRYFN